MLLELPNEILIQINSYLPIYNILKLSCVCKRLQYIFLREKKNYYKMILHSCRFYKLFENDKHNEIIFRHLYAKNIMFNNERNLNKTYYVGYYIAFDFFIANQEYIELPDITSRYKKKNKARLACIMGHVTLLRHLITLHKMEIYGRWLLDLAARHDQLDIVKYLCTFEHDSLYNTLLVSALEGRLEIVKYLTRNGINDRYKQMAIQYALDRGRLETAVFLETVVTID
jgi:hypothetical protein